jgi:general secretion pathway protein D
MSYSLIVYANKRNQQWIAELINELDEYRPQVLLDCTLVEVTQNEKFEYDLDIISKTYGAPDLRSGNIVGQQQSFVSDQYADARSQTTSDTAVFKAFFNSKHVQALLTAIQSKGYGRVMARPKILVNDNQEGEIKTENVTSIAQQSSKTIPGTGGSDPIITEDVTFGEYISGITLTIKPHISKGDMLRLEIGLNRKDFDFSKGTSVSVADKTYPRPPDLLSTDVLTVATIPDGTTIILGGLETIDQNKGHTKVPILGDLPIVGGLFRGVSDMGDQSKLYVFVKANILRPSDQVGGLEDIRRVSAKDRQEFEEMEKRFQSLQDWPGIDPKPMDPVKVLEEDDFISEIPEG